MRQDKNFKCMLSDSLKSVLLQMLCRYQGFERLPFRLQYLGWAWGMGRVFGVGASACQLRGEHAPLLFGVENQSVRMKVNQICTAWECMLREWQKYMWCRILFVLRTIWALQKSAFQQSSLTNTKAWGHTDWAKHNKQQNTVLNKGWYK